MPIVEKSFITASLTITNENKPISSARLIAKIPMYVLYTISEKRLLNSLF